MTIKYCLTFSNGNFKRDYYADNNSIIQRLFYGEQESFNVCHNCQIKTYNFSIFSFLIFPLEKVRQYLIVKKPNGFYKVTLEDCFEQYSSEEIMFGENQMFCNNCHRNSNYSMCNKIYKHPQKIVIILNRGKGLEFEVEFEYPKEFILNNYINFENNYNYNNFEIIEYELISVITHLGDSSMSGHFIAYCKSPVDNKWYLYNDAIVTFCEEGPNKNLNTNLESIPYVLFYQIKKNKFTQSQEYSIKNKTKHETNINEKTIVLYFKFQNGKELFLEVEENVLFQEAINILIKKYKLPQVEYNCYKENNFPIENSKSIKDNLLKNEDHINIARDFDI